MTASAGIALFAGLLATLFGAAYTAGSAIGPDLDRAGSGGHGEEAAHASELPPRGLSVAQGGLRLDAPVESMARGRTREYAFRILGAGGETVTEFEPEHERRMHVIVVRRDLTGYRHVHPRMAADGIWSTQLRLDEPGVYRVYADFDRGEGPVTLATDLSVPGEYSPAELPGPEATATTGRCRVQLEESGDEAAFTVSRGGRPVADIEPYLGARGHLVVLREGDLAYLHVHPEDEATAGREICFRAEYPFAGRYRMFLQSKHEGVVRTVAFTKETGDGDQH